ncbi:MAG: hypothetical protein KJ645_07025 [Planctomycetes bacterium]|nr:hypothetical protein [Planctomycetota bacterium]
MLRSTSINSWVLSIFLIVSFGYYSGNAFADDQEPKAYQVKVTLKNGSEFDAVIMDQALVDYFKEHKDLDLTRFDPDARLNLFYMRGMSGSMGMALKDLKGVTRLLPLTEDGLSEMVSAINQRIEKVRESDEARQAANRKKFAETRKKALEDAKANSEVDQKKTLDRAQAERLKWVLRFPPDQGWGPEKKEVLYRRSMTVGVFPNQEEQTFLDNYEEWLIQFDYWKTLEKEREIEKEKREAVQEPGESSRGPAEEKKTSAQENTSG